MKKKTPKGKLIHTVKVGERGQIVIPKDMREMFGIEPGDVLVALADVKKGIAIVRNDELIGFAQQILSGGEEEE